jgi:hypothetical protein
MTKRRIDREYIVQLLRSNAALLLLCFIAICVFGILLRGHPAPQASENSASSFVPSMSAQTASAPSAPENLAYSPLKNMPSPSTFKSFVYKKGAVFSVSSLCKDVYITVLIFPVSIDYRSDPLSASYNTATPCTKNQTYSGIINLDSLNLELGANYYVITASQGKKGTWYDPS